MMHMALFLSQESELCGSIVVGLNFAHLQSSCAVTIVQRQPVGGTRHRDTDRFARASQRDL